MCVKRSEARAAAMKLIYEWDMGGYGGEDTLLGLLEIRPEEKEYDYTMSLVEGVKANVIEIDRRIEKHAEGWKLDRLMRVDLAILRLASYEIMSKATTENVAINEAIELTHAYSTDKASPFVNGVLGSMVRAGDL